MQSRHQEARRAGYVEVYIPKVCAVETAAVVRRLSDRSFAVKISTSVLESYEVVDEAILFDPAWGIALDTGCSGFDSYFIALAKLKKAALLTDDREMHFHAGEVGVDSVLIRALDFEGIANTVNADS